MIRDRDLNHENGITVHQLEHALHNNQGVGQELIHNLPKFKNLPHHPYSIRTAKLFLLMMACHLFQASECEMS